MKTLKKLKKIAGKVKDSLYWDLFYTIGYSSVTGLGNGLGNLRQGESFSEGFGNAYCNNFPLGMAVNLVYPVVFDQLKETKHYRTYANLFTLGVNGAFLLWHYLAGTENPLEAMSLNTLAGLAMANKHVNETQEKDLENKLVAEVN